jgi:hypothetical protein
LEGQLSEKLSENATIHDYEIQINELNHLALSRAEQCELLKQSENDLRTALRQVRDVITCHANTASDGNNIPSAVQIVDSVLYTTSKKSNDLSSLSEPLSQQNSQNRLFLSPRFKKHIELMHSSDSEYSDDDRDDTSVDVAASTSLMADLALIAKGKVPPSLRSSNLLEAATFLSNDRTSLQARSLMKSTEPDTYPVRTSADPNFEKTDKFISSRQMYQSVFDRLGSPSQFTGTQKDKFHDSKARRDRTTEDAVVAEKDPRILFADSNQLHDSRISSAADRAGYAKQNVFDRLQKTNTLAAAIRQSETLHVDSRMNNDGKSSEAVILSHDSGANRSNQDENKRSSHDDDPLVELKHSGESRSAVDRAAYTKQNVFDRLQKTTTLAAAVRQSETLHQDSRIITDHKQLISPLSNDNETFPTKKSEGKRSSALNKPPESNDPTNLNVFERLNKTTTRAYAKKSNRPPENGT